MKTELKRISDVKVEMAISLGKEELAAAEQVALTKLARDIKVEGFRKGKAPLEMVKKQVDPNVLGAETAENAISKAVAEAYMAEDIQALDRPEVEVEVYVPGQQLEFKATAEVLPKVELGDYKKLKAKKATTKVTEEEITETIDKIRANFAEKKDVDRAAKNGDEVIIDFEGKKDGVPFEGGKAEHFPLELGSNSFIPGFEEGIVGHKTGDEFDLDLEFPKDYHSAELAGAKVVFSVKMGHIHEKALPEVNDEFAAKLGEFKTVADLKKQLKEDLKAQKESEDLEKYKDDLVRELVEVSKVATPEVLVNDQKKSIEMDMQQNLAYSGLTLDQYLERMGKTHDEWMATDVQKAAEDRVKAGLVLAELTKAEKIESTMEELEQRVAQLKEQYANSKEALKQLESDDVRRSLANQILTEKSVDLLVELNNK